MATKKKAKKKTSKPKKSASKRGTPMKAARLSKKSSKKKASRTRAKKQSLKKKVPVKRQIQKRSERSGPAAFLREGRGSRSVEQSGDLQGLSGRRESADSQSVDELIEEGNAFEADAVIGVENADLADGKEVRTHEVPEDDVPEEYLDKD